MIKRTTGILVVVAAVIAVLIACRRRFADGIGADHIYVCKPVPGTGGELGGIRRGYREVGRPGYGEVDGPTGPSLAGLRFEQVVTHTEGYTNGAAWVVKLAAGLMKVLDEIRTAGPRPGQIAATKHEEYLMQTSTYHAGSGTPAICE